MPILGIDHIQLAMPIGGEENARYFYEGLLGLPEAPKPAHLALRGNCWFESGFVKVHLGVEKEFAPARKAHPAFVVDDLPALVSLFKSRGYEPLEDEPPAGFDRVYVHDPFGNRIELMQPRI